MDNSKYAMNQSRRRFLGTTVLAGGVAASAGLGIVPSAKGGVVGGRRKTLVYVFLRGGMDGLSFVAPRENGVYGSVYAQNRDYTRLFDSDLIPLPGPFGLNSLTGGGSTTGGNYAGIYDLILDGNAAIVQAVGHKDPSTYTRSHFDAQEQVELGTPGEQATNEGWLARYLATSNDSPSNPLFTALVSGGSPPVSVSGWPDVATVDSTNGFSPVDNSLYEGAHLELLDRMYTGAGSLDQAVGTALLAVEEIRNLDLDAYTPAVAPSQAVYPNNSIGNDMKLAAAVIRQDLGVGAVTVDYGGWDTHNTQNVRDSYGNYASRLRDLSNAVGAFYRDMVAAGYENDVAVLIQSEFGRQVKENENRGTDHGLGNPAVLLASSAKINSGLFGVFPGFDDTPGNAIKPTTDFRDLMITAAHGVLDNPTLVGGASDIFPGHTFNQIPGLLK